MFPPKKKKSHNPQHASDVLHATHVLLSTFKLGMLFTPLEKFALIIAAIVHDVDHTGKLVSFQINGLYLIQFGLFRAK